MSVEDHFESIAVLYAIRQNVSRGDSEPGE